MRVTAPSCFTDSLRRVSPSRRVLSVAALSLGALTACGASSPPAEELAIEMIDTLEVSESVKACMRSEVDDFQLTDEQAVGFEDLDEVAEKAANGNELAQNIMRDFEAALASCM